MLKQAIIIISALLTAIIIASAVAPFLISHWHPMTVTITDVSMTKLLDNTTFPTAIPVNWSLADPDSTWQYDNLTVWNTGNVNFTARIFHNAPENWTITWTANNTVLQPSEWCHAPLILYVPPEAVAGQTYSWDCWVNAEEA